jgi:hypothetical protein
MMKIKILYVFLFIGFSYAARAGEQKVKTLNQDTYQVFEIQGDSVSRTKDGFYVYNNSDLWILYDFWGPQGEFTMRIHNKSSKQLTIDFGKSQFIDATGLTNQYWIDQTQISSVAQSSVLTNSRTSGTTTTGSVYGSAGESRGAYDLMATIGGSKSESSEYGSSISNGMSTSRSTISKPVRYLNIPANGDIIRSGFIITSQIYATLNFPINNVVKAPVSLNFNETNSPISFVNNISYSFEEGTNNFVTVINKFWISRVTNMSVSSFQGSVVTRKKVDIYGNITESKSFQYPYAAANNFYLYKSKNGFNVDSDRTKRNKNLLWGAGACLCGPPILYGIALGIAGLVTFLNSR